MKFLPSQLSYLFSQPESRRNLNAFFRFVVMLAVLITVFSLLFHVIMERYEGKDHSYITGFYWTLTVMTTLGFGDITFQSDVGRLFSIIVLGTGVILLLIVLPFSFIRYFYAPWLEAQIRLQAPREVPKTVKDHVIICRWDDLARGLVSRLRSIGVPYYVIEPDATVAASLMSSGISVVTGEVDARETYAKLNAADARLVLANISDAANTNVTLTVREESATVPVAAIIEDREAVDVLELSGATHSVALKERLGDHLASRVSAGKRTAHILGRYRDLVLAEFPVHGTHFAGVTIRETGLRQQTGLSVIGVWERGRLLSPQADHKLSDYAVAVVCGSDEQIAKLDKVLEKEPVDEDPVVVIGGGKVGRAVVRALKEKGLRVCVVEDDPETAADVKDLADRVIIGNAADRRVMEAAGLAEAPSVVLTTNDDAINVFLAVYCRKLNPHLHIVSRITHERNIEAVHRAGADFVLSYTALGVKQMIAIVQGRELVLLGEGIDLFVLPVAPALQGKNLQNAEIGARTGLTVIGIQRGENVEPIIDPKRPFESETQVVVIGSPASRARYVDAFG